MIKILDVCSGIGGFSLGLEATGGFDTVAFCEYDEFCRKVLNKHWPEVPIYKDLKEIGNEPTRLIQEFDLICGGIPCQPFSLAGKQKGKEDDRHLWPYMYEIIKHKKPTWVIVENVGGFVNVALDDVCLNLETEGYATQSFIIPACGVSAPHKRDRIWILGKLMDDSKRNEHIEEIRGGDGEEREDEKRQGEEDSTSRISSGASGLRVPDQEHEGSRDVADSNSGHDNGEKEEVRTRGQASDDGSTGGGTEVVADTEFKGLQGGERNSQGEGRKVLSPERYNRDEVRSETGRVSGVSGETEDVPNSNSKGSQGHRGEHGLRETSEEEQTLRGSQEHNVSNAGGKRGRSGQTDRQDAEDVGELTGSQEHREGNAESRLGGMVDGISSRLDGHYGFEVEPDIPRVAENIPDRVNRLKSLGNSIVPQIIYHIGMAILEEEKKN